MMSMMLQEVQLRHKRCLTVIIILIFPLVSTSQILKVKTSPIISSDHLFMYPSYRAAMGDISIAYDDPLYDAFVNPARIRSLDRGYAYMMPTSNRWSEVNYGSSISSIPVGFVDYRGGHFSAVSFEYQWLKERETRSKKTEFHIPVTALLGLELVKDRLSIGGGLGIMVIEGVDGSFLTPGALGMADNGTLNMYRFGVAGSFTNRDDFSLLGLYHHFNIDEKQGTNRIVRDNGRNTGWVLSADYKRMLSENLRGGLQFIANWKEYEGGGKTSGFDFGVGLSWKNETTLLGVDLVYEPVSTETSGQESYSFSNRIIRMGMETRVSDQFRVRLGSSIVRYQYDFEESISNQWTEVALTGGSSLILGKIELLTCVRILSGNGIPGHSVTLERARAAAYYRSDVIVAPDKDESIMPVPIYTFQLSLVYWL